MTRITVVPEQMRALSIQLERAGTQLRTVDRQMNGAISSLDWEARQKAGVDGQVAQARSRAIALAGEAERLARYVATKADAFTDADQHGAASLPAVPKVPFPLPVPPPPRPPWPLPVPPIIVPTLPRLPKIDNIRLPQFPWPSKPQHPAPATQPTRGEAGRDGTRAKSQAPTRPPPIRLRDGVRPEDSSASDGCVDYAQRRRTDLGATGGEGGAADYIEKFADRRFQIDDSIVDLREKIPIGAAIVWPRHHSDLAGTAGYENGHVAIVEEVGPDYVWLSQAGWGQLTRMKVSKADLASLFIIP